MKAVPITEPTRIIGPPSNWSEETNGECGHLAVRDVTRAGLPFMASVWKPDVEDLICLNAGGVVVLQIQGTVHPVVCIGTGDGAMLNQLHGKTSG